MPWHFIAKFSTYSILFKFTYCMKFDDLQQQQSYIGSSMTTPLNSVIESDCETADERCQMLSTLLMDEYTRTMDPARISCQPFHTIVTAT